MFVCPIFLFLFFNCKTEKTRRPEFSATLSLDSVLVYFPQGVQHQLKSLDMHSGGNSLRYRKNTDRSLELDWCGELTGQHELSHLAHHMYRKQQTQQSCCLGLAYVRDYQVQKACMSSFFLLHNKGEVILLGYVNAGFHQLELLDRMAQIVKSWYHVRFLHLEI